MRYIETLKDGERISEVYLCKSKSIALTKTGKEYANVMLADKTGQIDSKIWDLNSGGIAEFDVNDYEDDEDQLLDDISDWLSDTYGYCHFGFEIKF